MRDLLHEALGRSREIGYLGPGPVEDHILHARAFASAVTSDPARALDLGAGGGLPGLVLAVEEWPGCRWTFLDAQRKRTTFLEGEIDTLDLGDRVVVFTERAETFAHMPDHRGSYDLVVSRSFGPPAVTAECAAPLLRPGGILVVSEPPTGSIDRWPTDGLAVLGLRPASLVVGAEDSPAHFAVMERTSTPIDKYPRRVGVPGKRPIF